MSEESNGTRDMTSTAERDELTREALELYRVSGPRLTSADFPDGHSKEVWLGVARRARELHGGGGRYIRIRRETYMKADPMAQVIIDGLLVGGVDE